MDSAVPYSGKEGTTTTLKKTIPLEDTKNNLQKSLEDAALSLGVSRSTLKRICREYGIQRWPLNKRKKVNGPECSNLTLRQAVATVDHTLPNVTRRQDVRTVSIKASFGDDLMKFELSSTSGMVKLKEEIAKRLMITSFKIKYRDEVGDLVLVTCDADLRLCMDISKRLGTTTVEMLVQPKTN
ncbi:hypothetical protein F0562_013625 [Nyssa sinensis]|uniref:RWP-RK domain-containing protein n=1 Tax=Nyssa sinensis TaxID=561372 RepID=A0A5J4ZN32_9ASTE|nr:hypothetical protein F0562_013625 [Nyssa sinensis]